MPRPTTKDALLSDIGRERSELERFLETIAPEDAVQPGAIGEWSVKDVLAHLTEWEQTVLAWYRAGRRGVNPRTPADDLTWAQLPELNRRIRERWRDRSLSDVRAAFDASFVELLAEVTVMSEEELFSRGACAWTKTATLGSYVTSCTSSHYRWARTEMRRGLRHR